MRIPIKWLKEYVDINFSTKELADTLIMSGTEVEILSGFDIDERVVVGEILEINPHPNADRLRIPKVKLGKNKSFDIVCGASNIEVGQKVPVATLGAKLGDFEIKEAEIRGVKSQGMICSEQELGIAEHSEGIMVLDADAEVGMALKDALKQENDILDAELTPNRSDCFSILGIAREVATVKKLSLKLPKVFLKEAKQRTQDLIKVDVKNKDLCARYTARVLKIDKNSESPKWLKDRLSDAGIRPISPVVDVTNYVMLELGQPLHAFDYQKLKEIRNKEKVIEVRLAKKGEEIATLDKIKRKLTERDIVITDGKDPIAVAGVMGGKDTEVDENTRIVLLESAVFDSTSVRKTAQRLALRSESSTRFEKGIPLELPILALDRAASLLSEICGGEILKGKVDILNKKQNAKRVSFNIEKLNKFLGEEISQADVKGYLDRLGFEVRIVGRGGDMEATVPWWRLDIAIKEDIYEEVARVYGYNNIKSTFPKGEIPISKTSELSKKISFLKNELYGMGFSEVYNYSFVSENDLQKIGENPKEAIAISNPIAKELEYMRTSLVPSILNNINKNQNNFNEIKIYEIASTYEPKKNLANEVRHLTAGALGGEPMGIKYKNAKEFYILKGILERILKGYDYKLTETVENFLHPARSADVVVSGKRVGFIGEVRPDVLKSFDIKKQTAVIDIDLGLLISLASTVKNYESFSRFPSITRDFSFVLKKETTVLKLIETIESLREPLIKNVSINDIYEGKGLDDDKKSVLVKVVFQANDRTLEDLEISKIEGNIIAFVKKELGGDLR